MADASIFQQFLQPVRSVADYGADMDRQQLNALQLVGQRRANDSADLQLQQTRAQIADAAAKRNAIQRLYNDPAITSPKAREEAMLAHPLLMQDGLSLQEARLKGEKLAAETTHLGAQTTNQTALAGKAAADAAKAAYERQVAMAAQARKDIASYSTPADAIAHLQQAAQPGPNGEPAQIGAREAQMQLQRLQSIQTTEQFAQWKRDMDYAALDAKDRLEQQWKAKAEERAIANDGAQNANRELIPDGRGGWKVNQPLIDAKARIAAAGVPGQTPFIVHTDPTTGNAIAVPTKGAGNGPLQAVPIQINGQDLKAAPKGAGGSMSPTMQKELLETDDVTMSSRSVQSSLRQALDLNKQAYSGFGADVRAKFRSNLPGESAGANATVEMNNIILGQALESLKTTFGGAPTEGERDILIQLQASSDKTPVQREALLKKAIAAAQRREQLAAAKARAIREGTYLTGEFDPVATDPPRAAPAAPAPARGGPPPQPAAAPAPAGKGPSVSNW